MEMFGIKPSKKLGDIIEALKEAQLDGNIQTKDEAIDYVKTLV